MQYAHRSNWECVDNCVFFLPVNLRCFSPLLRRVFTRKLPVPGTSVGSVQLFVPGTSVSSERHSYPYPNFLFSSYIHAKPYPGIYPGYYPTENFCNYCRTLIPEPGTSVSSVRRWHKDPGSGTASLYLPGSSGSSVHPCHNTRKFWVFCKTFIPVPGTSGSSGRLSYPYPELL